MSRRMLSVASLALVCLFSAASAQAQTGAPGQTYRFADDSFSIWLPRQAVVKKTKDHVTGQMITSYTAADERGGVYLVAASRFPPLPTPSEVKAALPLTIEGFALGMGGKVLSQKEIMRNGYLGREFEVQAPGGAIVKGRVFVIDGRLYILAVVPGPDQDVATHANRFLFSFRADGMKK